ncbi:hypothetical protein TWF694_010680 [Orbilia ellipsospora]|uniref:Chitin synthase activator n=1 Tax=Orbilia ellipsospora TaxID=2528407 RepID=A0AAV9X839_9PEZI
MRKMNSYSTGVPHSASQPPRAGYETASNRNYQQEGYPPYNDSYHGGGGGDVNAIDSSFGNLSIQSSAPQRNQNPNAYPPSGAPGHYPDQNFRHEASQQQNTSLRNYGERRPPPGPESWQGRPSPAPSNYPRRPPPGAMRPNNQNRPPVGRGQPPQHGNVQFHRPRPPQGPGGYNGQGQYRQDQHNDHHRNGPQGYGRGANPPNLGRSQTMPVNSQQEGPEFSQDPGGQLFHGGQRTQPLYNGQEYPQYDIYNRSGEPNDPRSRNFDPMRGSVGDVLDLYTYDDSYAAQSYRDNRSNTLRGDLYYDGSGTHPDNFDQQRNFNPHQQYPGAPVPQAHRSKSQPNLRGDGYPPNAYHEPMPPVPSLQSSGTWNGRMNGPPDVPNQAPSNFRSANTSQPSLNTEGSQVNQTLSTSRPPPQRIYPNQINTDFNGPSYQSQQQNHTPSSAVMGSDDPDALPEHPAPVRPGLASDNASIRSGLSHHTPTNALNPLVMQGKMSPHDHGPVTFDMLNLMRNEIASKPANQPANPSLQLRFAKRLVEASFVLVKDTDSKAARRSRENFTLEAHKIVKKISSGTHPYPEAMFYLANCYGDGTLGLEVDHDRAFSLYQSAAKLNHPPSAYRTAVCCEIGAGTKKEPQKAFQWYRKAATLGDTAAMYKVGMIQHKGLLGQPRNDREAIVWLKRAAEQADEENPHALHQLGLLYESADGNGSIVRDVAYAKELFTKAAELGYPPSQYRLGTAYAYGLIGCPVDAKLSITWYSRAAASGDAESELALAGWYLTGAEGVLEQNDTEAYLWSRKAAEQGLAKAEFAVGHLTELGIGLDGRGSDEEARNWYFRAAGQGHPKAKERLEEMRRGAPKKQARDRLSRNNKAKDDADCTIM